MLRRLKFFFFVVFLVACIFTVFLVRHSMNTGVVVASVKTQDRGKSQLLDKYFQMIKDKISKGEDLNSIKNQVSNEILGEYLAKIKNSNSEGASKTDAEDGKNSTIKNVLKSTEPSEEKNIKQSKKPPEELSSETGHSEDPVDKLIKKSLKEEKERDHSEGDEVETTAPPVEEQEKEEEKASEKPSAVIEEANEDQELCPAKSDSLVGQLFVNQNIPKMEELEKHFSEKFGGWVKKGGAWKPTECKARTKVALIVPFRKRYEQLGIFVRHMHPMLKRQNVEYRIIIVEQSGDTPFNRAILFNIGYKESLKFNNFDCFIFHDVDLIPEDDRNEYSCPTSPRHMSAAVDKFNYHLPYASIFGGAGSFKRKDFEEINGFSNKFWGWGGEDDDLYQRITAKGFHLTRPSLQIGRYKMVRTHHHQSSKADPNRHSLLQNTVQRMPRDGLNTLVYKVLQVKEECLYTIVTIHVDKSMVKR
ncbi:beta-1,4-galactosyltransferase 5 isoform X1 [Nematostella vectensis]|uniref:beta-1,4-galactosyltransferase 5 isoform X1 n=1 Tax=Nematostella vectensis TaxID=45351 RepID=UPI0013902A93|nr:beta-1,4-galactosyltransferase 5 isoform X1 [Nematostella vectensis]